MDGRVNKAEPNCGTGHHSSPAPAGVCVGRSTDDWGGRTRGSGLGVQQGLQPGGRVCRVPTRKSGQCLARGAAWHGAPGGERAGFWPTPGHRLKAVLGDRREIVGGIGRTAKILKRGHIRRAPTTEKSGQHLARNHATRGTAWHDTLGCFPVLTSTCPWYCASVADNQRWDL